MKNVHRLRFNCSAHCDPGTVIACLTLLLTSCYAGCPELFKNEKACTCLSYLDGCVIRCKGPQSPLVVEKLKNEDVVIRELVLENADIIEIGPMAFQNLQIRSLNMDKNQIQLIHKDAFKGLEKSLVSLSLAHNDLSEIPMDSLMGMNSLLVLNLKCNKIGNIYTTALQNVSRLIELNLACNRICKISGSAFEPIKGTLQSLILDHNCLQEVPAEALRNFNSLLALHLRSNNIESIEKLQLMNMVSLLMVRLSNNKIKNIDRYGFNNIPNLRYLFLDHNELNVIEPNILQQFQYLEIADLSYNNIAEITAGAFQKLERLQQLNLEGNVIRDIAPAAFSQTPLLLLLLASNCLTDISQQMFQGIPFLRQLSLANNNIKNIQPFAFIQLANLQLLDLSNNKLDVVFPASMMPNFGATVIISENPVTCGPSGYHVLQGGKPIMLVSEQNLICQSLDRVDIEICPKRKAKLPQQPCCTDKQEAIEPVAVQNQAETTDLKKMKSSMKLEVPTLTTPAEMLTETPVVREQATTTSTLAPTNTTETVKTTTVQPKKSIKQKTPNMQRFWKLTRPPTKQSASVHNSTTRMPNITSLTSAPRRLQLFQQKAIDGNVSTANQTKNSRNESKTTDSSRERKILQFNENNSTAYLKKAVTTSSQKLPETATPNGISPKMQSTNPPNMWITGMGAGLVGPEGQVMNQQFLQHRHQMQAPKMTFPNTAQRVPMAGHAAVSTMPFQQPQNVVPQFRQPLQNSPPQLRPQSQGNIPNGPPMQRSWTAEQLAHFRDVPQFMNNQQLLAPRPGPPAQVPPDFDKFQSMSKTVPQQHQGLADPSQQFGFDVPQFGSRMQNQWEQISFDEPFLALHFAPDQQQTEQNLPGPTLLKQKLK